WSWSTSRAGDSTRAPSMRHRAIPARSGSEPDRAPPPGSTSCAWSRVGGPSHAGSWSGRELPRRTHPNDTRPVLTYPAPMVRFAAHRHLSRPDSALTVVNAQLSPRDGRARIHRSRRSDMRRIVASLVVLAAVLAGAARVD